tara:strand:- start:89 stop:280 length:192 start_codon:yes stop_codon:yes gene_type:complete
MYTTMTAAIQIELWALCAEMEVELKALGSWDHEDSDAVKRVLSQMQKIIGEPLDRTYVTGWHG